jgi:hypothetical protein
MFREVEEKFLKFIESERETEKIILVNKDVIIIAQKLTDKEKELTQNR